ncbi:KRAB-A domain-containing protein 2 [Manis pentadactyla]|uniref:KRAB-A domain-containing protein 2 n=1 Tax=Manis pentadactyla TaxID=143292 RepID=UPI00255CBADF|nr:KRAB-A domain-containing protein 2 [Manis pentadactyla]KAI5280775.1 Krab-A Domain-Containing Protein 2 [Manis pentadactyla]
MLDSYENIVPQGSSLQLSMMPQRAGNYLPGISNTCETEMEISKMREKFLLSVTKLVESKSYNSKVFSKEKYFQTIKEVKEAKEKGKKSSRDYRRAAKYDVISVQGTEKLIEATHGERDRIRYYVHKEELFDILHDTHLSIGHGGRTRMLKELQGKYGNVTKEVIVLYLTLCKQCHQKNPVPKRGLAPKPLPFKDSDSRCQVEILDMQSNVDGEFKFILYYQDHLTKFIILRPLKAKQTHEVVRVLLDIFTILGTPSVLESDSGIEFTAQVVNELNVVWPDLKIVSGKYHPGQGQGCLEQASHDVKNMLNAWMQSNHSCHWAEGLRFMQLVRNQAFDVSMQQSPFEAMFGCKAKLGLYSSYLPRKTVAILQTEEELEAAEEQLENSLWIRQEERAEIGADRSDVDEDIDPTPPEATEPHTSQGAPSLFCW